MADFSHITQPSAEKGARACFRDTDVKVSTVLGLLATGRSEAGILQMFPELTTEDIREALIYAARRMDEPEAVTQVAPAEPLPEPTFQLQSFTSCSKFLQPPKVDRTPAPERPSESPSEFEVQPESTEDAVETEAPQDDSLELYHPAYPDKPTVVFSNHGLFDRRWATGIVAWCDIRGIHRIVGEKTIVITLRNPQSYLSSMPFFQRVMVRIKLLLNMRTLYLDTASLGIRTRDLEVKARRLWMRHRGGRKKRRVRIGRSKRSIGWDDYFR